MAAFSRCVNILAAISVPFVGLSLNSPPQLIQIGSWGEQSALTTPSSSRYYKQRLTNAWDLQYWGDLDIGDQVIQGIMDTGSYELLVCSADCKGCENASVYSKSDNAEVLGYYGLHFFGSGNTVSQMVLDKVGVTGAPKSAELVKEDQYLWEVLAAYMPVIRDGNFQAIVGLGPPEVPDDDAKLNADYVEGLPEGSLDGPEDWKGVASNSTAKADELAKQPTMLESYGVQAFSFCFLRPYEAPGYMMWNDEDTRASNPSLFTQVAVTGTRTWGVSLTTVSVGSTTLGCEDGCGAILDTGTSLVMTDFDTWENMYNFLLDQQASGLLATDCSNMDELPDLVFKMGGVEFRLPPQAYVGQIGGTIPEDLRSYFPNVPDSGEWALCELILAPIWSETSDGPLWIMGMPFFREYYTSFDMGENPRDPNSRGIYTAHSDDDCVPTTTEEVQASSLVKTQRKTVRKMDLSKVRIPEWAKLANRTGRIKM